MSNATPSSNGSGQGTSFGLSALDRAWEVQWTLRLCCGVLFLDIALLLWTAEGLMAWSGNSDSLLSNLGFLSVALTGFALVMSLGLPVLGTAVRILGWELISLLPSFLFRHEDRGRPLGCVADRDLLELALAEKSDFLLDWYRRHRALRDAHEAFMQTLGDLVFGCLVLAVFNGVLPLVMTTAPSLIVSALIALDEYALPVALLSLLAGCALLRRAWFTGHATNWIYYPRLDLKLREKVRRALDPH